MVETHATAPEPSGLLIERALIGKDWISADLGGVIEVCDPATGDLIGDVPDCGERETARAIDAAAVAMVDWRQKPAAERATVLMAWHAAILRNTESLARLITLEQGKPIAEAEGEIRYAASFISWFAAEAVRVQGYDVPSPDPARRILVLKEPVGVCAAITPWNFPAAMITQARASACGRLRHGWSSPLN